MFSTTVNFFAMEEGASSSCVDWAPTTRRHHVVFGIRCNKLSK